jgi:hypothetical protein
VAREAPTALLKVADTYEAMQALEREAGALRALAQSPISSALPRCLHVHRGEGVVALFQEYRPRVRGSDRELSTAVVEFLARMAHLDRTRVGIASALDGLAAGSTVMPPASARVLRLLETLQRPHVWTHRTHGDFAPWNCAWTESGLFVYDWEASEASGLAFSDAFHFILAPGLLIGARRTPDDRIEAALSFGSQVAESAGIPDVDLELHLGIWMARQAGGPRGALYVDLLEAFERRWNRTHA